MKPCLWPCCHQALDPRLHRRARLLRAKLENLRSLGKQDSESAAGIDQHLLIHDLAVALAAEGEASWPEANLALFDSIEEHLHPFHPNSVMSLGVDCFQGFDDYM